MGRVHAGWGFAFLDGGCGIEGVGGCGSVFGWGAGGEGCEFGVGDFDVVYEDVGVVYGGGELVACAHVVVDEEGEVVGSWGDGDVGREGIFFLAGAAERR